MYNWLRLDQYRCTYSRSSGLMWYSNTCIVGCNSQLERSEGSYWSLLSFIMYLLHLALSQQPLLHAQLQLHELPSHCVHTHLQLPSEHWQLHLQLELQQFSVIETKISTAQLMWQPPVIYLPHWQVIAAAVEVPVVAGAFSAIDNSLSSVLERFV